MMVNRCWMVIVCASMLLQSVSIAFTPLYASVSKLEWHHNVKHINVSLEIIRREQQYKNSYIFELIAMRDLKQIRLYVGYSVRSFDGTVKNNLITRTLDLCQFLKQPNIDRLIKLLFQDIKRTSKLPTNCPVCSGQRLTVNVTPANMPVPGFIPETYFLSEVYFYAGIQHEPILETRWTGRLRKVNS